MTALAAEGIATRGFAVTGPEAKFEPFEFQRRDVGPKDILIEILYSGICHSDIHQAKGEWGNSTYPMVPGHEIVGKVVQIGGEVTKFNEGDIAGIGCFVDSCRECVNCKAGFEQGCKVHCCWTYNGTEMDETTMTFGGYSTNYVIDEAYALKVSPDQDLKAVAPLLCAGITTYSPLRRFKIGQGSKVGIVGLGGLGHMGVKLAVSMGADVTVFSTSPSKEADAKALGARDFIVSKDADAMTAATGTLDFILDTVSADHDVNAYLNLLGWEGTMVLVGLPTTPMPISAFNLIFGNHGLVGSGIGGIPETQEMLDYCAAHNITSDIELITPDQIETAYERTLNSDVRYRFVIDMQSEK
jgi:uncharacterized zinc-type alcohol dehydrogenase-like protein